VETLDPPRRHSQDGVDLRGTTVTADDANGNPGYYLFDNLTRRATTTWSSRCRLCRRLHAAEPGHDDAVDSDADASGADRRWSPWRRGFQPHLDAGLIRQTGPLSLGDTVFRDLDNDGLYEPADGEFGIDGVKCSTCTDNGNGNADPDEFFATTQTNTVAGEAGIYLFEDLPEGDYIVEIDPINFARAARWRASAAPPVPRAARPVPTRSRTRPSPTRMTTRTTTTTAPTTARPRHRRHRL
jgi:hypothetical protein